MNKLTSWKRIGSLLLTLAMVFTMSVTALPVYAAGTGTISVKYNPEIEGLDSTDFTLYKVGKYGREGKKSVIVLEDEFADSKVVFPNGVGPDDPNWQSAWLGAAEKLGNWVKNHESSLSDAAKWTGTLQATDSFQDLGEEFPNGVYLLVGKEKLVDGVEFCAPVPVLIQVLNGESEFSFDNDDIELKMVSRPLVHKHIVNKFWQDEGYGEGRPEAVKVALYYGDTRIDTVEFNGSKGYTYTWYSYYDKASGKMVYTSKDPEKEGSKGVETEKLNEGNSFRIMFEAGDATWGAEELPAGTYADGENMYVANIPTGQPITDDSEKFDITNTVVLPADHDPPVLKTVKGDKPEKDETFEFSLTAISTTADIEEMPMPEGSSGGVKTLKAKAGEEKEFGDIVFRIPGTYVYEIKEINTGKEGYKYDPAVYKLVYEMSVVEDEPGVFQLHMDRKTYKDGVEVDIATYSFENEYTAPSTPDKSNKPKTGDTTNIIIPAAIFAAAVIAFLILFLKKRKDRKNGDQ